MASEKQANPIRYAGAERQAVILIGHGSLRSASGASMIRIAARLRARESASMVEPAFLNYSRPTLADTVAKCHAAGATAFIIQPYFLIGGAYVQSDLPALVEQVAADYPGETFRIAEPFNDHPALIDLATLRIRQALTEQPPAGEWQLLLLAHGSPMAQANAPLYAIADSAAQITGAADHRVAFLDCNTPDIPTAYAQLYAAGAKHVVALPYFLHRGRHVAEDLPALTHTARSQYPHMSIHLAQHLDYDPRLVDAAQTRLQAVQTSYT